MSKTYTIKTLAERLGKTRPTIYKMLQDGRLPAAIPNTKPRLWDGEKIENWIAGNEIANPQLDFGK